MADSITLGNVSPFALATTPIPSGEHLAKHRPLIQAVKALNATEALGPDHELTFSLDRETRHPVIRLVDRRSKEVIQQIPSEAVLKAVQEFIKNSDKQ